MTKREKLAPHSKRLGSVLALAFLLVVSHGVAARGGANKGADRPAFSRDDIALPPDGAKLVDAEPRRRDSHMTREERYLLRQHIENAGRDLYKR